MDKQVINVNAVTDHELDTIVGGCSGFEDSYATDICATCGQTFRGTCCMLKEQEEAHTIDTGHTSFRPND